MAEYGKLTIGGIEVPVVDIKWVDYRKFHEKVQRNTSAMLIVSPRVPARDIKEVMGGTFRAVGRAVVRSTNEAFRSIFCSW